MGQRAMVLGLARSGIAVSDLLLARGWEVLACDTKEREKFEGALDGIEARGAKLCLGEKEPERLLPGMDMLVVSPGVPLTHPIMGRAKELGIEVVGEIEYAYRESKGELLAVTGTNGKTTTVTLLGEIFKNAGKRTHGKRVFKMAPLHHHFELSGIPETRIVTMYYIVTAALCLISMLGFVA